MNGAHANVVPCCGPGSAPLPAEQRDVLAASFKALADPTRIAIVNRLASADEVSVCVLVDELELSQPTISHHLRVLREAGLVEARRRGTWAYYRLVPAAIEGLAFALAGPATTTRRPAWRLPGNRLAISKEPARRTAVGERRQPDRRVRTFFD